MIELVSFLMHELRWPAVELAIREGLAGPPDVSTVRHYSAMLDSFSDAWRDRDLYARFED
ncbi:MULTISPECIES: hypothetical protein [unclassified Kribbella]|uniref:hypothetical protein n=1 Tax=unclassified Kribbella TaxID=2644121 RepID=UPI003015F0CC